MDRETLPRAGCERRDIDCRRQSRTRGRVATEVTRYAPLLSERSTARSPIVHPILLNQKVTAAESCVRARAVRCQVGLAESRMAQSVLALISVLEAVAIIPAVAERIGHETIKRVGKIGDQYVGGITVVWRGTGGRELWSSDSRTTIWIAEKDIVHGDSIHNAAPMKGWG